MVVRKRPSKQPPKSPPARKPDPKPWLPAEWDLPDVVSMQACVEGTADEDQQKRAMKWIIEKASGVYEQSFYPGGEEGRRDTDFAEGRRYVGNAIVKLLHLNVSALRRKDNG